jgi:FPC/CPF motif-containing protein YcgG
MNPFSDALAIAHSNYSAFDGARLVRPLTGDRPPAMTSFVHDGLRALVLNDHFTCLGGKSAVRRGAYRFGLYPELGSEAAAAGLARDLFTFVSELPSFDGSFTTYLASFIGPHVTDERTFEARLWRTLQDLHDRDARHHDWDRTVSADPADPRFSFSFGGVAFFVIGLHAASSRATRRFAWPTLVFNPHRQFDRLRDTGEFRRFQQVIRRGEQELQGDINPMLADHGTRSEAVQYSGRQVDAGWTCPFHAHADHEPASD